MLICIAYCFQDTTARRLYTPKKDECNIICLYILSKDSVNCFSRFSFGVVISPRQKSVACSRSKPRNEYMDPDDSGFVSCTVESILDTFDDQDHLGRVRAPVR